MPLLTLSLLLSLLLLLLLLLLVLVLVLPVLVLLLLETYRERKKSVNKGTKEGEEGTTRSDLRRPLPCEQWPVRARTISRGLLRVAPLALQTSGVPMLSEGLLELE